MSYYKAPTTNFWSTTINGSIDSSVTTITLNSVTGLQFPGVLILDREDGNNTATPNSRELVSFTGISGNDLTGCTRGFDGSTARSHSNGALAESVPAVGMWNDLRNPVAVALSTDGANLAISGTASISTMIAGDITRFATSSVASIAQAKITNGIFSNSLNASGASVTGLFPSFADSDGWSPAGETWTYASADAPTFTFTIAGVDKTTKYYAGMKIKLTQTTPKFFVITKVAFSTDTTVTVYGGTDYVLANAAITSPFYSLSKSPAAFPLDPLKWVFETTDSSDRSQAAPAANTWYNLGAFTSSIPIGAWDLSYDVALQVNEGTSANCVIQTTLSTATSSATDNSFTTYDTINVSTAGGRTFFRKKDLNVTSKTPYYLNSRVQTAGIDSLANLNATAFPGSIKARCSYI